MNATQEPWSRHYRMFDYVTKELPALIEASFPVTSAKAITGHSMGGHGSASTPLHPFPPPVSTTIPAPSFTFPLLHSPPSVR